MRLLRRSKGFKNRRHVARCMENMRDLNGVWIAMDIVMKRELNVKLLASGEFVSSSSLRTSEPEFFRSPMGAAWRLPHELSQVSGLSDLQPGTATGVEPEPPVDASSEARCAQARGDFDLTEFPV